MTPPRHRPRRGLPALLAAIDPSTGPAQAGILAELRRAVVAGAVPPGASLPVDALAGHFGVSPIPIRETLKTLQGEGLVAHEPGHGYVVAQLTLAEYTELYVARGALEQAALGRAVGVATAADLDGLRGLHAALGEALERGDYVAWHRISRDFHEALVRPCAMQRLLQLLTATWNTTQPVPSMTLIDPEHVGMLHAEHAQMLEHFAAGAAPALLEVAAAHHAHLIDEIASLPAGHALFADPA